jgi:hypothetical protein
MITRIRHTVTQGTAAAMAAFALLCAQAAAAETVSPLPSSAYTVRAACRAPSPGHASCLALQLVPRTAAARAHTHPIGIARAASAGPSTAPSPAAGDFGLRPHDLHAAYDLPLDAETSSTQTIALVDSYNDLNAAADLETYDTEFGLPKCTAASGCFEKVNQDGSGEAASLPFPKTQGELTSQEEACEAGEESACALVEEAQGWSVEISLDIETARAVCQNCHIALVEADEPSYADLDAAEEAAVRLGAEEISNSWGSPECVEGSCERESSAFDHPGVVITVAAGDDGYLSWLQEPRSAFAGYPASLPQVVAVGGTRLAPLGTGGKWEGETVWNDGGKVGGRVEGYGAGGGGCSSQFSAQPWQRHVSDWSSVGCASHRAVADVAADADPYSGLAVYDTSPDCVSEYKEGGTWHAVNWCPIGGTSLASPLIASVFALAGGSGGVRYPAQTLYQNAAKSPGSLHDVTEGSNGECDAPFDEATFTTGCTQAEEAKTSCASELICQAGAGYDGPTGVGTPDGIGAFELPAGGLSEEPSGEETSGEEAGGGSGGGAGGGSGGSTGSGDGGSSTSGGLTSSPGAATPTAAQRVLLSGLALTLKALVALNTSRPKIPDLSFTFTANVTARVSVGLGKRVGRRGHQRWQALTHPLTVTAIAGRNNRRLGGHGVLSSGTYRLTLTPVGGAAQSILFKIG